MSGHGRTSWLLTAARGMRLHHRVFLCVQAAGIAAVLLAYTASAGAESFGRWFFSTEERRILDDMRDAGEEPQVEKSKPGPKAVAPVVDVISFDGKVERSGGGGSTVWVNGRPVFTGNRTAEGIRVEPSRGTHGETRFVLPPSDTGTTKFSLKAGQKVAVQNGRKFDAYEARPGEDSESVIEEAESTDTAASPDAEKSTDEPDESATSVPSPGS